MNTSFSERDAVFLAEMGLAPLWQLRAAEPAAAPMTAEPQASVVEAAAPAAVPALVVAPAPAPIPTPASASTQAPPQAPAGPLAPARGPSPLQRVAQSASALEPVAPPASPDAAWDDAALARDATLDEIAAMDWDALQLAIASCRRCSACRDGRAPVPGTGARQARWLVAAGASTAADEKARLPLAGDPGKLLDGMLGAVGLARTRDVYITNLIKCRPITAAGTERAPTADEAAACRPYLERELALSGAGTVLTLGQIAANTLLGRGLAEPLAGARGQVHALHAGEGRSGVRLVATLHPGQLLQRGLDKAQAWADLCRARAGGPAPEAADGGDTRARGG
jgi:uracil-DNA glycosylase family 4